MTLKEKKKRRQELKEAKKKRQKKEIVEIRSDISKIEFKNKKGKVVKLTDIVTSDEFWPYQVKRTRDTEVILRTKYVLSYEAVKKIAHETGISVVAITYKVKPEVGNRMSRDLVLLLCCDKCKHEGHLDENKDCLFPKVGEASEENTHGIAKAYKAIMAEKRAFVRGVIDHLGLPDMYGENEIDEEENEPTKSGLKPSELTELAKSGIINKILNAASTEELEHFGQEIKEKVGELKEQEIEYLRALYGRRLTALSPAKF